MKQYRIFIGVGHGGIDPGAVKYVRESWANLVMALELRRLLQAAGQIVGMSRTVEENDDINEEIREANAFKPDLAVEIHNNAGGGDGWECYVQTNQYATQSRACAADIEEEVKKLGQQSRGLKTNSFGWTRLVDAPAVLTEGFFVDNLADATDFDTEVELKALAGAYARGILKYLGVEAAPEQPKTTRDLVRQRYGLAENTLDHMENYGPSILRKLSGAAKAMTDREQVQTVFDLSDAEMKHLDTWPWAKELYRKILGGI